MIESNFESSLKSEEKKGISLKAIEMNSNSFLSFFLFEPLNIAASF